MGKTSKPHQFTNLVIPTSKSQDREKSDYQFRNEYQMLFEDEPGSDTEEEEALIG